MLIRTVLTFCTILAAVACVPIPYPHPGKTLNQVKSPDLVGEIEVGKSTKESVRGSLLNPHVKLDESNWFYSLRHYHPAELGIVVVFVPVVPGGTGGGFGGRMSELLGRDRPDRVEILHLTFDGAGVLKEREITSVPTGECLPNKLVCTRVHNGWLFIRNGEEAERGMDSGADTLAAYLFPDQGKHPTPENGLFRTWHPNGQLEFEVTYEEGRRTGLSRSWHENGQLEAEATWKDDVLDGIYKYWDKDGQFRYEKSWKEGSQHGLERHWNSDGTLRLERCYSDNRWARIGECQ
jgi:MORN repeat protein